MFNPWWDIDPENDYFSNSAEIRRNQLKFYLEQRAEKTKYLLVGEAAGYQGAHFSGIAMTSERILLGYMKDKNILAEHVFTGLQPSRTSCPEIRPKGFSEPTATVVWSHIAERKIDPYSVAIFNALPWHPFNPQKGLLSNRTPSAQELEQGKKYLEKIIEILNPQNIIAVGQKASDQLSAMKISHEKVRHPANGGASKFKQQFKL